MVIPLDPQLEARLTEIARNRGTTPEAVALDALRERFPPPPAPPIEPRDEWEWRLLSIATDCGVSLPDSALTREAMYD